MLISKREAAPVYLIEPSELGQVERPRHILMTTAGDGTGNSNFINNYSVTPADLYYQAVKPISIYSLQINISDGGSFAQTEYGNITALANGVKFFFKPSGMPEVPLVGSVVIKNNLDLVDFASRFDLVQWSGTPQTFIAHVHTLEQYGCPILLAVGDRIIIRLNDNFTGLINQVFTIGGKEFV